MLSVLGLGMAECESKAPCAGNLVLRVLMPGGSGMILRSGRSWGPALAEASGGAALVTLITIYFESLFLYSNFLSHCVAFLYMYTPPPKCHLL